MQCKDISDTVILTWLNENASERNWATIGIGYSMPTVSDCMPKDAPLKLQLAKMNQLLKRGLIHGCGCGCRGDFFISEKGKDYLALQ